MPAPTPEELHARALAAWRSHDPGDTAAARYANTEARMLTGQPAQHKRAERWVTALHRYEQFWRSGGRRPRENTRAQATLPATERRMGEWARYQRRFENKLNAHQRARLDVSPAFTWHPWGTTWQANLAACLDFIERTGRPPRLSHSDDHEFALARWLGRQLHRLQRGQLPSDRVAALNALLHRMRGW